MPVKNDPINAQQRTAQQATADPAVTILDIAIDSIRRDGGAQMRSAGVDPAIVAEYAEAMRNGAVFPPVSLFFDGVDHWPADGFHRIEACLLNNATTILAEVRHGTKRDAIVAACGANASHGLRSTVADKRRAVESLLRDPEWTKWSDREIGKTCACDHKTVAKIRREVSGEIPSERTYRDRHGNTTVMKTATRNADNGTSSSGASMTERLLASLPDATLVAECKRRGLEMSK